MRKRKSKAEEARLSLVPGSDKDMEMYLQARAVDELLKELDTINRQAQVGKINRANQS